jgi:putative FmdB family regulatory protein
MPLYEYQCLKCQKIHEQMQKFSDPPLEICPECGGSVSKLMSLSSFSLKGSGWYTSDYKQASSAQPTTPPAAKPALEKKT